jgi:ribonuclease T2
MQRTRFLFAFAFAVFVCGHMPTQSRAQEVKSEPGHFDFYELNLSWAPAFCDNLKTLTAEEQAQNDDLTCSAPHAFVLHGLWPQNADGSWPANCSTRPGPLHPERNLDMTPSLPLLKHEWAKHGTCTTLSPEAFFATARQAYTSVEIPEQLKQLDREVTLAPDSVLGMFYRANPSFPQGSFALSCKENRLTAVEACFSKGMQPMACKGLRSCDAQAIQVKPQDDSGIVE